jgi:hypothetical protein
MYTKLKLTEIKNVPGTILSHNATISHNNSETANGGHVKFYVICILVDLLARNRNSLFTDLTDLQHIAHTRCKGISLVSNDRNQSYTLQLSSTDLLTIIFRPFIPFLAYHIGILRHYCSY